MDDIYERFNHLLTSLDLVWVDPELSSEAIEAKGAPLQRCWGVIDGHQGLYIARPIRNQRVMFSGRKGTHRLKF